MVEGGRPQITVWRMRTACWIPRAPNTIIICNTYYVSIATMVARRASMLRHTCIAGLVNSDIH
jgi:hypothetical protein